MFIPAEAGVMRSRWTWSLAGNPAQNVMYWYKGDTSPATPDVCQTIANAIHNGWKHGAGGGPFAIQDLQHVSCELVQIEVEDAHVADGAQYVLSLGEFGMSASTQNSAPAVAAVARLLTGFRGRSKRGRIFWPGIPGENVGDNGSIDNVADWDGALAAFLETAGVLSGPDPPENTLSVVSFFTGVDPTTHRPIPRAEGLFNRVTSLQLDSFVKSQRRRNHAG